jgi:hypothetical protein
MSNRWRHLGFICECSQSKQWMHTHSPNKSKNLKQMLSTCQKPDAKCFLGQEMSADGGIHATKDHIISVLQTLQNCVWPFRIKGILWSSIPMRVNIQLLTLEHCWSISTGSCLTTLLIALILPHATAACLPTWRTGWGHSASTIMRSWQTVSKQLSSQVADFFDTGTKKTYSPMWQVPQFSGDYIDK